MSSGTTKVVTVATAPTDMSAAAHRARMLARKSAMPKMMPPTM
jgi:hypothetical protein